MKVEYEDHEDGTRTATITGLLEYEPVFPLRARDTSAVMMVNHYRQITEGLFDEQRSLALEAHAQEIIDWRRTNQELVRDPD